MGTAVAVMVGIIILTTGVAGFGAHGGSASSSPPAADASTPDASRAPSGSAMGVSPTHSPPLASPRGRAGNSTSPGGGSGPSTASVTVLVAAGCVQPGGQEKVTVESTPGLQVSVNTRYADGQMGSRYGGLAVAQTIGRDGRFTESWTVSSDAPVGPVSVVAGVASTNGPTVHGAGSAQFAVASRC